MKVRTIYSLDIEGMLSASTLLEAKNLVVGDAAGTNIKNVPGLGAISGNSFTAEDVSTSTEWLIQEANTQIEHYKTKEIAQEPLALSIVSACERARDDALFWRQDFFKHITEIAA